MTKIMILSAFALSAALFGASKLKSNKNTRKCGSCNKHSGSSGPRISDIVNQEIEGGIVGH